jgi:hypothetical protein
MGQGSELLIGTDKDEFYRDQLAKIKWSKGYRCIKCNSPKSYSVEVNSGKRCTKCGYSESATANTPFHKIKFSLHVAFQIMYHLERTNNKISTSELASMFGLQQKTCWLFKKKITVFHTGQFFNKCIVKTLAFDFISTPRITRNHKI